MKKIFKDKLNRLKRKHDKAIIKATKAQNDIINTVFATYMDEEARNQLLKDAKTFNYSEVKTENIKKAFENYNKDTIDYNVAMDIIDAKNHIYEFKSESFFSKIANVIISEEE